MLDWLIDKGGKVVEWFVGEAIVKPVKRIVAETEKVIDRIAEEIEKLRQAIERVLNEFRKAFDAIERLLERIFGSGSRPSYERESVPSSFYAISNAVANNPPPVVGGPKHALSLIDRRVRRHGLGSLLAALMLFAGVPSLLALLQLCSLAAGGFDLAPRFEGPAAAPPSRANAPVRPITAGFDGIMAEPLPAVGSLTTLRQDELRNRIMVIAEQRPPLPPRDDAEAQRWYREVEARVALLDIEALFGRIVEYEPGVFDNYTDPMDYLLEVLLREMLTSVEPQPAADATTMIETAATTEVLRQAPRAAPKAPPEAETTEIVGMSLQGATPLPAITSQSVVTTQTAETKVTLPDGGTVAAQTESATGATQPAASTTQVTTTSASSSTTASSNPSNVVPTTDTTTAAPKSASPQSDVSTGGPAKAH